MKRGFYKMALNVFMANGRLTKDLELRKSQTGVSNVRFTLAVNRNRKNENGETEADFLNCIAFNKTAELLVQYCGKGSKIGIRGSLQTGSFEKDGVRHFTTDVLVNEIEFLDTKQQSQQPGQAQQPVQQFAPQQQQQFNAYGGIPPQQQYQQPMNQQQAQQFTQQMGAQVINDQSPF